MLKIRIMAPDSREHRIPVALQIFLGVCILCALILTPIVVSWYLPVAALTVRTDATVYVKILAINDFHGQLTPGQTLNAHPVGSAPVLVSYLKSAMASGTADSTIIALPGDVVGVSPPESGLLLDEPTLLFFNTLANPYCTIVPNPPDVSCNMVATLGNHEFDYGVPELMRKMQGGDGTTDIPHLVDPYPGTKTPYVSANVVWKANNTLIVPPYILRNVSGVRIAFIGADTTKTPGIVMADNIEDVTFLDEAESINRYIPEIQAQGVHAIVILLHEGESQSLYDGPTRHNETVTGRVMESVPRLDRDIDVVLSGHTHQFTNAYLTNAGGNSVLVTQAYSHGQGFADIDLTIDRATGEITGKSAQIVPAYADMPPGTSPDPATAGILAVDENVTATRIDRQISVAALDITRGQDPAGESALGDPVVDSQRAACRCTDCIH